MPATRLTSIPTMSAVQNCCMYSLLIVHSVTDLNIVVALLLQMHGNPEYVCHNRSSSYTLQENGVF